MVMPWELASSLRKERTMVISEGVVEGFGFRLSICDMVRFLLSVMTVV